MSGEATAKPSLRPARPKVLPNERRTTAPRSGRKAARLVRAVEIGEGFVDDQHASAPVEPLVQREKIGAARDAAVGIVGIDDDRDVAVLERFERPGLLCSRACGGEGLGVPAVGRSQHADGAVRREPRQRLDQRLRARAGDDGLRRGAVPARGGRLEAQRARRPPADGSTYRARDRAADRRAD